MTADESRAAFDRLRAVALVSVVTFHASLGYAEPRIPRVLWATHDPASNGFLAAVAWATHLWSMPAFFLLAGHFAAESLERHGPSAFLARRARRLGLPFLVGALVLLPATFYVWSLGWWLDGLVTPNEIRRVRFLDPAIQDEIYGPAHLWFLPVLLFHSLALAAVARLAGGVPSEGRWHPLAFAVATAAIIGLRADVITVFRNELLPLTRVAYYAVFFAAGAVLPRRRPASASRRRGLALLALALPCLALSAMLAASREPGGFARLAFAASSAGFVWLALVGALEIADSISRTNAAITALARASYWIYLIHLPIVGLLLLGAARLPLPPVLEVAGIVAAVLAIGHASYARWPRLGALLGDERGD